MEKILNWVIIITFEVVASKMQDELADVIKNGGEANDYELIMYKYLFINELNIPLHEDLAVEINEDSFILYIVSEGLDFSLLRKLDDSFDRFEVTFMPNSYNFIKLKFTLGD